MTLQAPARPESAQPSRLGRPLRVLAFVNHAWPVQRGGSEVALHGILRWLAARGHHAEVIVVFQRGYRTDGVKYAARAPHEKHDLWEWADVAFTQQGATPQAAEYAREHSTPLAFYVHNLVNFADKRNLLEPDRDLVVWNTHAIADTQGGLWPGRALVVRPPVFPAEWAGQPGELVTQINLCELKGGAIFWELARREPDRRFLAVVGGWGPQLAADRTEWWPLKAATVDEIRRRAPGNVEVIAPTTNMLTDVYARTRVLLIPTGRVSEAQVGESYGIVAAEALCSGIPVLARYSPGITEILGDAGLLLDDDPEQWMRDLGDLDDPDSYAEASARALARSIELDPEHELEALELALADLAGVAA